MKRTNRHRIGPLALAATVLTLAPLAPRGAGAETLREQSDRVLEAKGVTALEVENARGLVEVVPSADGLIHVRALKVSRAPDRKRAEELAREVRVELTALSGTTTLRVRYPQHREVRVGLWEFLQGDVELPRIEVRLRLEVPPALPLTVRATSGDVRTEALAGRQTIEVTSGDVEIQRAAGRVTVTSTSGEVGGSFGAAVRIRSVSGDLTIERAAGPLDAHTTSGEITLGTSLDSLVLGTVSGDVVVKRATRGADITTTSGSVDARVAGGRARLGTGSGDIELSLERGAAGADVSSGSGDIVTRIAPGLGVDLDIRTSNGTIDTALPLTVQSVSRRQVAGRIGGGGMPVHLRSSSGDIQILSGRE